MSLRIVSCLSVLLLPLAGCASHPVQPAAVGMANPASVYCVQQGGRLQIVQGPQGESGLCTLPDGQQIEEWTLFRQQHPASR